MSNLNTPYQELADQIALLENFVDTIDNPESVVPEVPEYTEVSDVVGTYKEDIQTYVTDLLTAVRSGGDSESEGNTTVKEYYDSLHALPQRITVITALTDTVQDRDTFMGLLP